MVRHGIFHPLTRASIRVQTCSYLCALKSSTLLMNCFDSFSNIYCRVILVSRKWCVVTPCTCIRKRGKALASCVCLSVILIFGGTYGVSDQLGTCLLPQSNENTNSTAFLCLTVGKQALLASIWLSDCLAS